jgi:hypothetical protein
MDIVKNPIIIGLLAGTLTYMYMSWNIENSDSPEYDIVKDRHGKKHKTRREKPDVNLLIPLVVAIIIWFVTYAYFEYQPETQMMKHNANTFAPHATTRHEPSLPILPGKSYTFTKDVVDSVSSDPRSFSLLNQGVNVPHNLPDVMIDLI